MFVAICYQILLENKVVFMCVILCYQTTGNMVQSAALSLDHKTVV